MDLTAAIATHLATWDEPVVEPVIFGDPAPSTIATAFETLVATQLRTTVVDAVFYQSSVGAVAGVVLADGRRVVVKAHAPHVKVARLAAMQDTMRALARTGFPCPTPVGDVAPIGRGAHATIETLIDAGEVRDGYDPVVRRELARRLAELVAVADVTPAREALGASWFSGLPDGVIWPRPHSALFDFAATTAGAAWIDAFGARARAVPRHGRRVIGHFDWRAEHVRFAGDQIVVAYDWDSLHVDLEPVVVGAAAHAFTANWEREDAAAAPSVDDMRAFVADYEAARGAPFDRAERRTLAGALVFTTAYTARCVHANWPNSKPRARAFVELLGAHGDELLAEWPGCEGLS
ncbi:MAG TPA: phosphotransferase [Kofleriaceae bacterium]|nr:phosphotransferase [Kofleriaceae bacterium]